MKKIVCDRALILMQKKVPLNYARFRRKLKNLTPLETRLSHFQEISDNLSGTSTLSEHFTPEAGSCFSMARKGKHFSFIFLDMPAMVKPGQTYRYITPELVEAAEIFLN